MNFLIENYSEKHWPALRKFLADNWSPNHPVLNKELFDWQYEGFGKFKGNQLSKVITSGKEILGFRGVIPGSYFLPIDDGLVEEGGSFAMWMVSPSLRGKGIGYSLMKAIEEDINVLVAVGSNPSTSVPIYLKNNFSHLQVLNRYFIQLEEVFNKETSLPISEIYNVKKELDLVSYIDCHPEDCERIYISYLKEKKLFGLFKTKDFWEWRYFNSKGFSYKIVSDNDKKNLVVFREEEIKNGPNNLNGLKVLRIIEIIPSVDENGEITCAKLLNSIIWKYKRRGFIFVDYFSSNKLLEKFLLGIGFVNEKDCSLTVPGIFNPYKENIRPINAFWRVKTNEGTLINFHSVQTFFVKSDNDMDRPISL